MLVARAAVGLVDVGARGLPPAIPVPEHLLASPALLEDFAGARMLLPTDEKGALPRLQLQR